jgi:uncharacterized NAD-dependent epimerase/dehydratase family protein
MKRIVILTEANTHPWFAKTASALLRYRSDQVVALIDSTQVGRTANELLGVGGATPIVANLDQVEADELVLGVATEGHNFPAAWREIICRAIDRGIKIVNGSHFMLADDAEFAARAALNGTELYDVRKPRPEIGCAADKAKDSEVLRIHTVGTECAVGKMTVAIELDRALRDRGKNSRFIATGQTGIMVAGYGLPLDRFVADFLAGGAEWLVMHNLDREIIVIEGQGSLFHPLYSGVTLGILHGCAPDFLVLCDDASMIKCQYRAKPPLPEVIDFYERTANYIHPCRVVGIATNTRNLSEDQARVEIDRIEATTSLPATDVIRFGSAKLVDAILTTPRPLSQRSPS